MSYIEKLGFRLVPSMACLVYYGDKLAQAEIRRKLMPRTGGPDFPIVVTSYEMAMSDAKILAHYRWKYIVFDEVTEKRILSIIVLCGFHSFVFICLLHTSFPRAIS